MRRKAQAAALRQLVTLLQELADVYDIGDQLMKAIDAYEREPVLLRTVHKCLCRELTPGTRDEAIEILKQTGYIQAN